MDILNFISDDHLRKSLDRDYKELENCLQNKAFKAVYLLAGSLIEAVLVDHLLTVRPPAYSETQILSMDLDELVKVCNGLGMLSSKNVNLMSVVRGYRNLIHPGREVRLKESINPKEAMIARELVDIVLEEINQKKRENYGYTAEQITSKILADPKADSIIDHLVRDMKPAEVSKLLMDSLPEAWYDAKETGDIFDTIDPVKSPISRCFRRILSKADYQTQTLVAKRHVKTIKEESSTRIRSYDSAFGTCEYVDRLDYQESQLVLDHFLSLLEGKVETYTLRCLEGIGKHLHGDKAISFMQGMVGFILRTDSEEMQEMTISTLANEYARMAEGDRKAIDLQLAGLKLRYEQLKNPARANEVNRISTALFNATIPF